MSLVLDALRRGRSRIPEPVHPARTETVLQTLGRRRSAERASRVHVTVGLAGFLLAAGVVGVLLFVTRHA